VWCVYVSVCVWCVCVYDVWGVVWCVCVVCVMCVCVCIYIYIYIYMYVCMYILACLWALLNFVSIDGKITVVPIMWNCVLKSTKSVQGEREADVMACHCGLCVI